MKYWLKKLKDLAHLIKSKSYILITNKQTILAGHFSEFDKFSAIHYLKLVQKNIKDMLKRLEENIK
jgi:hypothetical protein